MVKIFKFLYDTKAKPIPFKYKLLNSLPLTEYDLTVNGNLSLYNSNIKSLPNNLTVNGHLFIDGTNISELPDDLIVADNLYCYGTPLSDNIINNVSLLNKYSKQIKGYIYYDQ